MGKLPEDRELVVYSGCCFTIEWFYRSNGKSPALDYYNKLSDAQRRKLLLLVKRMGDAGKIFDKTKFRKEGDKIYAFKPQPDRFLCFFHDGNKLIITSGFRKKTRKLPEKEKLKALNYMDDYKARVSSGEYYE